MSTVNTHPLSSMLNRNLRVFENIKSSLNKEVTKQISLHERYQLADGGTASLFNQRDFKIHEVQSRIVVMAMDEPQLYFKVHGNALEKYGQAHDYKKIDLELDDRPYKNKRSSISGWLNI